MLSRRHLIAAATTLAAAPAIAQPTATGASKETGAVMPTKGPLRDRPLPANTPAAGKYRPAQRFGLGGAPLGNNHAFVPEKTADDTIEAAWNAGIRFYDTSPWYGLGYSERRFGRFLQSQKREDYVLSTKIGRVLTPAAQPPKVGWKNPPPFNYTYDYSADGTRRSIEDSLTRMGVSSIDVVLIHDISPDNGDMKERWAAYFDQAAKGAMPTLTKMREEGIIKAWGLGVNMPDAALRSLDVADPDIMLLAAQYSLIEHEQTLAQTFPALQKRGVSVILASALNAGYMVGRDRYNYAGKLPTDAPQKRERLMALAARHGIDLRTAALQFATRPDIVSVLITGARTPDQIAADVQSFRVAIPPAFWSEAKQAGLIGANAPVPA